MKKLLLLVSLTLLTASSSTAAVLPSSDPVPGRYIVVLRDDLTEGVLDLAASLAALHGGTVSLVYEHALKGFAIEATDLEAAALSEDPRVAFVEEDGHVYATATQINPPWGLDRTDQRSLPLSGTYTYGATGAGVKAYVIDTGVRATHRDFGGRVARGYDALLGLTPDDCNGHGTHVAGTIGGSTYGIAKGVTLVPVRVLTCAGAGLNSQVIAGVDWVTADHLPGQPAVANMSLGGGASSALDAAVRGSIADGVTYAVAAGNDDDNACDYSPARVSEAMTIGATDNKDNRASYSNWGSCVDFFAPGSSVTSAWFLTDTSTNTISGTSMATPHVAGVAAQYLQSNPAASPAAVRNALFNNTTKGVVKSSKSTNSHLLFTSY